jgi:hypothetical protein
VLIFLKMKTLWWISWTCCHVLFYKLHKKDGSLYPLMK